jgi:hypothetical protein
MKSFGLQASKIMCVVVALLMWGGAYVCCLSQVRGAFGQGRLELLALPCLWLPSTTPLLHLHCSRSLATRTPCFSCVVLPACFFNDSGAGIVWQSV